MAKKSKVFVKLETKHIKRRYKESALRHRKKLGPKHHLRVHT